MVYRLRHLSIMQFALVAALLYALFGILAGLFWWLFIGPVMLSAAKMGGAPVAGMGALAAVGALAIVLFPIFYGVIGFIAGLIYAAVYNIVASWTGGIEFTLQQPVGVVSPAAPIVTT